MKKIFLIIIAALLLAPITHASQFDVRINEVAWMGTKQSANNEWIELFNTTDEPISLNEWVLTSSDDTPTITLKGIIAANDFYLLERTDDTSSPAAADQIYKGALGNNGETLTLLDGTGAIHDRAEFSSSWPFGNNDSKRTMERATNTMWQTSELKGGTPGTINSSGIKIALKSPPPALLKDEKFDNNRATVAPQNTPETLIDKSTATLTTPAPTTTNPSLLFFIITGVIFIVGAITLLVTLNRKSHS